MTHRNVSIIGLSNLEIVWNLDTGIWDFLACDGGSEFLQSCWVIINLDVSLSFVIDFLTPYTVSVIMHASKKSGK
jgi:hypothetical protein